MRQSRMQNMAMRFTRRSAVRSFDASALQPDFMILWKTSIFQRNAYQSIFSIASARECTGMSVISFQSMGSQFLGDLVPELRGLYETHDDRGAFPRAQQSGEHPV